MTRFHLLRYFIREAFVNINRNKLLNSIAIGMIAVSLAIFGIFLLVYTNLNTVVRRWTDSVQVIAYLEDQLSDEQRMQIDAKIREIAYIDDIVYISKEEALKKFTLRLVGHEQLLEGLEINPLPASLEIKLKRKYRDLTSVQKVVEIVQNISHVDEVQYGEKWLENLTVMINMLKFIGAFLGVFLFLTVIFIVSNTIKLALYTREEEVNIMKFVGATETFIKGPFLAEGIIRGFLGSLMSLAFLYLVHKLFTLIIHYSSPSLFSFSSISFLSWAAMINFILLGSFLGWCGSLLTLHKFLKTY